MPKLDRVYSSVHHTEKATKILRAQNIVNDDRDFWTCTKVFQLTQRKGNNMDAYVKTTSEHRYQTEPLHFVTVAIVCRRNDSLPASENFPTIRSFVNLTEMCTMFTNPYFSTRLHSQRLLFFVYFASMKYFLLYHIFLISSSFSIFLE